MSTISILREGEGRMVLVVSGGSAKPGLVSDMICLKMVFTTPDDEWPLNVLGSEIQSSSSNVAPSLNPKSDFASCLGK